MCSDEAVVSVPGWITDTIVSVSNQVRHEDRKHVTSSQISLSYPVEKNRTLDSPEILANSSAPWKANKLLSWSEVARKGVVRS